MVWILDDGGSNGLESAARKLHIACRKGTKSFSPFWRAAKSEQQSVSLPMIILGIDPGSRITGFGIVEKAGNRTVHRENGSIYLETKKGVAERLVFLHQELTALINAFRPEALAIENIFYQKNPKSLQKLGEFRGVAMLSAAIAKLAIFEYTPREVKKAITGYGNATKEQVQYMVRRLLNLPDLAEENASDALGIALCHAHSVSGVSAIRVAKMPLGTAQELLKKASYYR